MPTKETSSVKALRATAELLERAMTQNGESLAEIAASHSVLLVFLRHAGCTFCREALADISHSRAEIESRGSRIVLVHMGDIAELDRLLEKNALQDVDRICDTAQDLYKAFGLKRGSALQLFGPKVWLRGVKVGLIDGHGVGKPLADSSQMPGVFLLEQGMIARRFRHKSAADRPDYASFCLKSAEQT